MGKRYSPAVLSAMKAVRLAARQSPSACCPLCGGVPSDRGWSAHHVFPLLGETGPLVATCLKCNQRQKRRMLWQHQIDAILRSPLTVRSRSGEEIAAIGRQAAADMFGSAEWITILFAAERLEDSVVKPDGSRARYESQLLREARMRRDG